MKTTVSLSALFFVALISCDFGKSASVDLLTELRTRGNGLSCDDVYLSDGEKKLNRNNFTYGETFYLNFDGIRGFQGEGNSVFPGMQLYVISGSGDTVLQHTDLYADYLDGIDLSPLLLNTNLTLADPIHSGQEYTLFVKIWDKKGSGTFEAVLDFKVRPNENISIKGSGVEYNEIYLFSALTSSTITGNTAGFNETVYLLFEGLKGFTEQEGMVNVGLSMQLKAADGEIILDEKDLIGDGGMNAADFRYQLAPNFVVSNTEVESPVSCVIVVWDKAGSARIEASVDLLLK